jgi:hypothetical protein
MRGGWSGAPHIEATGCTESSDSRNALSLKQIGTVDPTARKGAGPPLPQLGCGHLGQAESIWPAEFLKDECFHFTISSERILARRAMLSAKSGVSRRL